MYYNMDKFITEEVEERRGGGEGKDEYHDHDDDETPKKKKVVRNRSYKKTPKVIAKASPNVNDVTENINKLAICNDNDAIPEKITTFYSKSGNHMFQYSNKKTPFENACPWLCPGKS